MRKFFQPNLEIRGRIVRGVSGALMVAGGLVACPHSLAACIVLVLAGGFVLFEASRGWCIMRACGIKTRI